MSVVEQWAAVLGNQFFATAAMLTAPKLPFFSVAQETARGQTVYIARRQDMLSGVGYFVLVFSVRLTSCAFNS